MLLSRRVARVLLPSRVWGWSDRRFAFWAGWLIGLGLAWLLLRPLGVTQTRGTCMSPAIHDGQWLVYSGLVRVRVGEVVVAWSDGDCLAHRVTAEFEGDDGRTVWVIEPDSGGRLDVVAQAQIAGVVVWPRMRSRAR